MHVRMYNQNLFVIFYMCIERTVDYGQSDDVNKYIFPQTAFLLLFWISG